MRIGFASCIKPSCINFLVINYVLCRGSRQAELSNRSPRPYCCRILRLEQLTPGTRVTGVAGNDVVEVIAIEWFGGQAVNLTYRAPMGPGSRILYRDDEQSLNAAATGRAFAFTGDGETFRLASEAQRIRLAHLFDPYLALETSRIQALPHQITAVYG